jgi:transcriptional regulatory protein RtcR
VATNLTKSTVLIGILGPKRDAPGRTWRPSVAVCSQPRGLRVDRFELLHTPDNEDLAKDVRAEIRTVSPKTEVRLHVCHPTDPWDFETVYPQLHRFACDYRFQLDREEYLVHMTQGTGVMKICLFLLAARRYLPAKLVELIHPERDTAPDTGAKRDFFES